mgnify:CR=1 FL=1
MPVQYGQGDIFRVGVDDNYDFIIVFGHVGLNEMAVAWNAFRQRFRVRFGPIDDPFRVVRGPVEFKPGRWIQFFGEEQNHGISDSLLRRTLESALAWASEKKLQTVITNGIANTDHGTNTALNRASDDRRAIFIESIVRDRQHEFASIMLISLNDAFVRNFQAS